MKVERRALKVSKKGVLNDNFCGYDYDTDHPKPKVENELSTIRNPSVYMPSCNKCGVASKSIIRNRRQDEITDHLYKCKKCLDNSLKSISDNILSSN